MRRIFSSAVLAVLALLVVGCGPQLSFEPVGPLGDGSTDRFSFADIELAYANKVKAAQIYPGYRIKVIGNVRWVIGETVGLECGSKDRSVTLYLPRENLAQLSKGQRVSYECTFHKAETWSGTTLHFRRCTPTLKQIRQTLSD